MDAIRRQLDASYHEDCGRILATYERALSLAQQEPERRFLEKRLRELA
jgi:predicted RNA polymerase sigma factor